MLSFISNHKEELIELCQRYEVAMMYVFGSAATGNFKETSDIDFLISFKDISFDKYTDYYFELHEKLEEMFGRSIDLLTERSLTNPIFIKSVEENKQLLYAA